MISNISVDIEFGIADYVVIAITNLYFGSSSQGVLNVLELTTHQGVLSRNGEVNCPRRLKSDGDG